jgi:hypothetical protein
MNAPRKKSPRAPSIALDEAVDRVSKVYERERRHAAPTDVVAQDLGYKSANNGSALSTLASLRYFGLLERPKDGFLAVTKEFESYQFAPDERMRREILLKWLRNPPVFAELLDTYGQGLPSDATVRFDLIQRGFAPSAAESLINVFKRSVAFAGPFEHSRFDLDVSAEETNEVEEDVATTEPIQSSPTQRSAAPSVEMSGDMDKIPVRLSGNRRAWLIIPTPFYNADRKRLKAQIDLLLTEDDQEAE